jgi:hypothetical protein
VPGRTLVRAALSALACAALAGLPGCRRAVDAAPTPAVREAAPERFEGLLAEGDRAFAQRSDRARLDAALRAYSAAASQRPSDLGAELRLARAEAFRALAASTPAVVREASEASARAAERALRRAAPAWAEAIDRGEDPAAAVARVDAAGAEPLYWFALGTMRAAQATGYAAVLAVKDAALAMMARAAELDEHLDAAGPHRALGAWRAMLPVAAGGGAAAARAHFDRARALAPDDPLRPVVEAETWAVLVQDAARFDALLAEVLALDPARAGDRAPEAVLARRRARELLDRKGRLF